jgi:hypothetical protein
MNQHHLAVLTLGLSLVHGVCAADRPVTTTRDSGPGSLRQAILDANRTSGPDRIQFDAKKGPFAKPQRIRLASDLPPITDTLEIDGYIEDRLWEPSGVTIDGAGKHRLFRVAPDVTFHLRHLNLTGGSAEEGGALSSSGTTEVDSVACFGNQAARGGAIAQTGGRLWIGNASFWDNTAREAGGAVAIVDGDATLVHTTLHGNHAPSGANLHNGGRLVLANSILAHGVGGADCTSTRPPEAGSTHNLIMHNDGCGTPFSTEDPNLGQPGLYNGPTLTLPLMGGSPAINWADPAATVDAHGERLVWDQRGNGDPRDAAGLPDLGAFEVQAVTVMEVDVTDDVDRRGCTSLPGDCSLRGAIAIANASPRHDAITFENATFQAHPTLALKEPLPVITQNLTLSAPAELGLRIQGPAGSLTASPGVRLELQGVTLSTPSP